LFYWCWARPWYESRLSRRTIHGSAHAFIPVDLKELMDFKMNPIAGRPRHPHPGRIAGRRPPVHGRTGPPRAPEPAGRDRAREEAGVRGRHQRLPRHRQPHGASWATASARSSASAAPTTTAWSSWCRRRPRCIRAYNVTGEDSWVVEIAVIDVSPPRCGGQPLLPAHRNGHGDHPEPGARAPADAAASAVGREAAHQESAQRVAVAASALKAVTTSGGACTIRSARPRRRSEIRRSPSGAGSRCRNRPRPCGCRRAQSAHPAP
jgi:hypothetical protein